jgi:hypothetical protein
MGNHDAPAVDDVQRIGVAGNGLQAPSIGMHPSSEGCAFHDWHLADLLASLPTDSVCSGKISDKSLWNRNLQLFDDSLRPIWLRLCWNIFGEPRRYSDREEASFRLVSLSVPGKR